MSHPKLSEGFKRRAIFIPMKQKHPIKVSYHSYGHYALHPRHLKKKDWYWRATRAGRIVANGKGYNSKSGAKRAWHRFAKAAASFVEVS